MLNKFINNFKQANEVYLRIKVKPGKASSRVKKISQRGDEEIIEIEIAAPANKGQANSELVKFLAGEFGASRDNIKLISGAGGRWKLVKISKK